MTHNRKTLKSKSKLYDPGGSVNNKIFHKDNEVERIITEISNEKYISDQINKINSNQEPPLLNPFEKALSPDVALLSNLSKTRLMEISKLFWLPKKIDPYKSESKYANSRLDSINTHSWFKMNQISQESKIDNIPFVSFSSSTVNQSTDSLTNKLLNAQQRKEIYLKEKEEENQIATNQDKKEKNKKRKYIKTPKTKKIVNYDPSKKGCTYILTKKIEGVIYGRECNDLCEYGKSVCKKHLEKENNKYDILSDDLCKHVITQLSGGKDRKGMYCNHFTSGSPVKGYCKEHCKQSHQDVDNFQETVLRSFKVRFYPNKEQIRKLTNYFGCARFTYNKCVQDKFEGSKEEVRDKYVTASGNTYYNEDNINIVIDPKKVIKTTNLETSYVYPLIEFTELNEHTDRSLLIINNCAEIKLYDINNELLENMNNFRKQPDLIKKYEVGFKITDEELNVLINSKKVIEHTNKEVSYTYPLTEFNEQMKTESIIINEQSKTVMDTIIKNLFEDSNIHNFNQHSELCKKYEKNNKEYITYPIKKMKSFVETNEFLYDCPKDIRAFAAREYLTAKENTKEQYARKIKSNLWKIDQNRNNGTRYKIRQIKYPELKCKTKKDAQCITSIL